MSVSENGSGEEEPRAGNEEPQAGSEEPRALLVTGGAGFIGSNFVLEWVEAGRGPVVNLDALTYAGHAGNLAAIKDNSSYKFVHGDIRDGALVERLLGEHGVGAVVHFAAESHVDRSITGPEVFLDTNVRGSFVLLEAVREYLGTAGKEVKEKFRFVHVSTDEVYGSLGAEEAAFTEERAYRPNSPYAASKAASDHLARAYFHTYGVPVVISNCSNNYGPRQFPEKLIPLMILMALKGERLPVYGDGKNVRDWLYVGDHCAALRAILERGRVGETYNVGGNSERTNLELVEAVCGLLDELRPDGRGKHSRLIEFVEDRPGHDRRYAMDAAKLERELGWSPEEKLESGLRRTVEWYLENAEWVKSVTSGEYRNWMETNYGTRAAFGEPSREGRRA
jgi:dTDP-glucose 4,6-dehydratase